MFHLFELMQLSTVYISKLCIQLPVWSPKRWSKVLPSELCLLFSCLLRSSWKNTDCLISEAYIFNFVSQALLTTTRGQKLPAGFSEIQFCVGLYSTGTLSV